MTSQSGGDDDTFGPTIFRYTHALAVEDGTLVDLSKAAPEVCGQHFKYNVCCTAAVWSIIERAVASKDHANDLNGVIHDILWMSIRNGRDLDPTTRLFRVIITGAGPQDEYELKIVCGPAMTPNRS